MKEDILFKVALITMAFFFLVLFSFAGLLVLNETFGEEFEYQDKCIDRIGGEFLDEYCEYEIRCMKLIGPFISSKCDAILGDKE